MKKENLQLILNSLPEGNEPKELIPDIFIRRTSTYMTTVWSLLSDGTKNDTGKDVLCADRLHGKVICIRYPNNPIENGEFFEIYRKDGTIPEL